MTAKEVFFTLTFLKIYLEVYSSLINLLYRHNPLNKADLVAYPDPSCGFVKALDINQVRYYVIATHSIVCSDIAPSARRYIGEVVVVVVQAEIRVIHLL